MQLSGRHCGPGSASRAPWEAAGCGRRSAGLHAPRHTTYRKFSAVLGVTSANRVMTMRPASSPAIETSKNTRGLSRSSADAMVCQREVHRLRERVGEPFRACGARAVPPGRRSCTQKSLQGAPSAAVPRSRTSSTPERTPSLPLPHASPIRRSEEAPRPTAPARQPPRLAQASAAAAGASGVAAAAGAASGRVPPPRARPAAPCSSIAISRRSWARR